MIDNINNLGTNPNTKTPEQNKPSTNDTATDHAAQQSALNNTPQAKPDVQISDTAQMLDRVQQNLDNVAEIDDAKVAEIKARIANGEYKINPANLAKRMTDMFGS